MKETLRDKTDNTTLVLKYPLCSKEPTSDRYFHGAISANEANDLLLNSKNCKSGSYLVRESRSEPQNYVLSVRIENKKVIHLIINYTVTFSFSLVLLQPVSRIVNFCVFI